MSPKCYFKQRLQALMQPQTFLYECILVTFYPIRCGDSIQFTINR